MNRSTYQGEDLLLIIHLIVQQTDNPLHLGELREKVNFAFEPLHRVLVCVLERHPLERPHLTVLSRHPVHLGAPSTANDVEPRVALAVHPDDVPPLFRLCRRSTGRRRRHIHNRHFWWWRRRPVRRVVVDCRERFPVRRHRGPPDTANVGVGGPPGSLFRGGVH